MTATEQHLDPETRAFYCRVLTTLNEAEVPYLVGGAYAMERYTGIKRHTKDLDIFVRPADYERVSQLLADTGCSTELTFPHWLGKAYCEEDFVDIIFNSGNGIAEVDDEWFANAVEETVFGIPCKICPPEEILWSKTLIMERERFDGADVAHLLRVTAESLDWDRVLRRFGEHWRPLLSHLILFGFIYPGERNKIPERVMRELIGRLQSDLESPPPSERVCLGTILSRSQYLIDVEQWGYRDGRVKPHGGLTKKDVVHYTEAFKEEEQAQQQNHGDSE